MALEFDIELPRRDFLLSLSACFHSGITGIFGPSGAGKTSFFNLISGLERPARGRILLDGKILVDRERDIILSPGKRNVGVVFQDKLLFPHLNVEKNLAFGMPYARRKTLSARQVAEWLDLTHLLSSYPHEISGGEQQRTAVGRALLCSPDLLLLDEPFSAVDSSRRDVILPYLKTLHQEMNIPILVISHDLSDLERLAYEIFFMEEGRFTGSEKVGTVFRDKDWKGAAGGTSM